MTTSAEEPTGEPAATGRSPAGASDVEPFGPDDPAAPTPAPGMVGSRWADRPVRLGSARILVIDCRDSFVYTIVDYLAALGAAVTVRQADDLSVSELAADSFDGILLSPGPGAPAAAVTSRAVVARFAGVLPILGVCLGHQVIAEHYGATVERAPHLRHGETSHIHHDGTGVFTGLPNPFTATRYHSLAVLDTDVPRSLRITARSESGVVMGLVHRELPIEGVQFHPEAILTEAGHSLFANWLRALEVPPPPLGSR